MFFWFTKRKHLKLLNEFEHIIDAYFKANSEELRNNLRPRINKLAPIIKRITIAAKTYDLMTASFRAAGQPDRRFCPFDEITSNIYGHSPIPDTINMLQRTIGLYESGEIRQILKQAKKEQKTEIKTKKSFWLFNHPIPTTVIGGLILAFIVYCFFPHWIGLEKLPCYSTDKYTKQVSK